jgi:hypothetical protein
MLTQYTSSGLSSAMSRRSNRPEETSSASSSLTETMADIADEYHALATVFRAFAIETIISEVREELFLLAEGFEQLVAETRQNDHLADSTIPVQHAVTHVEDVAAAENSSG